VVIRRQHLTSGINSVWPKDSRTCKPRNKVLYDALKNLMKDVWCDGKEDISEWEAFPEWMKDWFDTSITTRGMESVYLPVGQ
jgi:hypothetical protein